MGLRGGLTWTGMLLAIVSSCRSHESFCSGDDCNAVGAAGTAGDGGDAGQASAGQAGTEPAPPCRRDRDCQNDSICDGQERCTERGCEPGAPHQCPLDSMLCDDEEPELCLFEVPSPWLVLGDGEKLIGLPASELGKRPLLTLATHAGTRAFGYMGAFFSTDGKVAISISAEEEFLFTLQYLRFGRGLPSELLRMPDVPIVVDTYDGPALAPDSSYALVHDDVTGTFLAPLQDANAPTLRFPPGPTGVAEAGFCEAAPSFWQIDESGATSIVTPVGDGVEAVTIAAEGAPAFSWENRFVVQNAVSGPGVVVSRCSPDATSTVFAGAQSPIIGPGSRSLLVSSEGLGLSLYSLEDPEQRVVLWSSHDARLDDPRFSASGGHLVGEIDDVLHVADLSEPKARPASLGLPASTSIEEVSLSSSFVPLIGDSALLATLPSVDDVPGALVWQALAPGQKSVVLLPPERAADAEILLSQHDTNEVFIAEQLEGARDQLHRLRLDTARPQLETLFTLEGDITHVERAPDGSGLALMVDGLDLRSSVWWVPLARGGSVETPILLSEKAWGMSFQPQP
jgi:hypothetical protein